MTSLGPPTAMTQLAKTSFTLLSSFQEACSMAEASIKNTSESNSNKKLNKDLKVDLKVSTKNVIIKKEIEKMKIENQEEQKLAMKSSLNIMDHERNETV